MSIKKGDKIKVEYTGTLDDGTVFDSSDKHGEPLEFEVGSGQLIKGFDDAVIGMKKGDKKEINLKPDQAYGDYNSKLIKKVPKDQMPKIEDVEVGMMLMLTLPSGVQITASVTELDDDSVTLDLNHPLAGKNLNFNIKILDIVS
jgi:FKBP-type peptidyl-prolyl cis-trans isomerase 2